MSTSTQAQLVSPSALAAVKKNLIVALFDAVRGVYNAQDLIYRDLTPQDISPDSTSGDTTAVLNNPSALVASVWSNDVFSGPTLDTNQAIGIYGYGALSAVPHIKGLRFGLGSAKKLAQLNLDVLYTQQEDSALYFGTPITWGPQQYLSVDLLADAAVSANAENFSLFGFVVEPAGKTVAPDFSSAAKLAAG